jgi:predicted TIM-barrel fold metal-dependent hydrolase
MTTDTRAIDYWTNIFTPQGLHEMYMENDELKKLVTWWSMDERLKGYSPEEFVKMMDQNGIAKVYVPSFKMWSYKHRAPLLDVKASVIRELMAACRGRVGGMYGVDITLGMDGVRELEKAVKEWGFEAAHVHSYGLGMPLNHRDLYPFYAKCVELDIPVVVQSGHSAERMPSAMAQPILLDDVALYFPELRIVASHTGWPWVQELVALAWKHPNLYIGGGAHAPKYWDPALVQFLNSRGKGKVLWGTDFPVVKHADSLAQVAAMNLKPESREMLLYKAARNVFRKA